jgi:hypothetical protein
MMRSQPILEENPHAFDAGAERGGRAEHGQHWARSSERFDRIAYAMRLLKWLRPRMTVAVYECYQDLHIERGKLAGAVRWAMVGIPRDASREHITVALAELASLERAPFVVDLLRVAANESSA